jgi:spore germination protein
MRSYKPHVIWITVVMLLAVTMLPATPAYAFSLDGLLGQSADGGGFLNILLGLLLGKLLGQPTGSLPTGGGKAGVPGTLTGGKEMMAFYAEWWGGDTSSYDALVKNVDTIRTIIPFWATMQADGSLSDRGGDDHAAVVKYAHAHNGKALLLVNNAKQDSNNPPVHTVLSSPALRSAAVDNLEAYIKKYNLDGVNIDFEMVPPGDRDNMTAFMKELYGRLKPQGYIVSIDVFPKTDEENDVAVAYDYGQLAKYADRIVIMTYDNHGAWSDAGPIAPIGWVEDNLKYALKFIPKNKLYLGVAGYGYDWSSKGVESLEYGPIMNLADRFGRTVNWDNDSKSPHFNYTGPDGIEHSIWFENRESLKFKLDLVNKYDIAGAALWKLGEEDPGYWQVIRDKL